ncbi:hypothetical protein M2282_001910 [Variovorax boronicumulans]|uniref:hypothetical protein n=1 Tax=Variovorax boronicumulans TaxID=436515 RepID=UPI00247688DF|nr:hypothetical protein [Variovorax boronicumulans]MDH6166763.1 hypothetical protein [Variovorax boronicumulans]
MPLPRHRRLNVQEQNALAEVSIRNEATHWRLNPLPEALRVAGLERGVQWEKSIVVDLDIDFPGMPRLFGLLLAQDGRFIDFAIDTDETHGVVESVDTWEDMTAVQDTSLRNRGFGAGPGAIANKVLRALNAIKVSNSLSHENNVP